MGFLNRTVFAKRLNKSNLFVLAFVASIISCGLATVAFSSYAFAAEVVDNYGLYTAPDGVRWEWEVVSDSENTNEPQKLNLMFYDKPENLTTVTVPSYNDMTTITGVTPTSDTFYVRNANQESQDTRFANPDPARRIANQADVTVLDMTNTSKVQVMGVKPIINPETEVELIFGENMVIGDEIDVNITITAERCVETEQDPYYGRQYNCVRTEPISQDNLQTVIPDWNRKKPAEKTSFSPSINDMLTYLNCSNLGSVYLTAYTNVETTCYAKNPVLSMTINGAFSGYKLSTVNLENIKYFGWYAFSDSTFNESSRTVIIKANQTAGEGVFQNTNIANVTFEGDYVYPNMFRNCTELESVDFGDVDTVGYRAFENSSIGSVDFSQTNIKTIQDEAFRNAGMTSINLDGIKEIGYRAFALNDIQDELYLPKSIDELGCGIFYGNTNIRKITVAYDTLSSGTEMVFSSVLDGLPTYDNYAGIFEGEVISPLIEELVILAPYAQNEEVKPSHMSYAEYRDSAINKPYISLYNSRYGYDSASAIARAEDEYANTDSYKNIIAPQYFVKLSGLKKITIGEGYEYIGNGAFAQEWGTSGSNSWGESISYFIKNQKPLERIVLPESLKGVGSMAITYVFNDNFEMNLPSGIDFIGFAAFRQLFNWNIDLNLPNLKFLGDYAFYSTMVHDIELHNDLEYVGVGVFNDCPNLHDITFDYDVFGPDAFPWWLNGSTGSSNYRNLWGSRSNYFYAQTSNYLSQYGFELSPYNGYDIKYGTIKFTENSINPFQACELQGRSCSSISVGFFDMFQAETIDLSDAKWEYIPEYMFERAILGKILLPSTLKKVNSYAFADAAITEEIILPDGLETIEDFAFQQHHTWYLFKKDTINITSLPKSLKQIGTDAFYLDQRLNLDEFDLPNLEILGNMAFAGATIKNITLGESVKQFGIGAFRFVYNIEDVTIDFDIFNRDKVSSGSVTVMSHPYAQNGTRPYLDTRNVSNVEPFLQAYFNFDIPYYVPSEYYGISYFMATPWSEQSKDTSNKYGNIVFTEKSITAPFTMSGNYSSASSFFRFRANKVDLSRAGWETIPMASFLESYIDEVKLPETLKTIGRAAFFDAAIASELVLPEGLKVIEKDAFSNYPFLGGYHEDDRSIYITSLPDSLEIIDDGAFYADSKLKTDFILPNIKLIGRSAFMRTALRNVTIGDSLEYPLFSGAFSNIPTLEEITIDYDFYGSILELDDYKSTYCNQSWDNPDRCYGLDASFFQVFNTTPYNAYAGSGIFYDQGVTEIKPYKKVVFTEKSVSSPTINESAWYSGRYARLLFDELDLSRAQWKEFNMDYFFQDARIKILKLPAQLEKITKGAFFNAVIDNPVDIPETVQIVEEFAFQNSSIELKDAFHEGLRIIGKGAFYAAQVSGDMTIPSTVTSIGWSAFNAGDKDTNYGTVTVKPALNYDSTDSQAIFQMFWNAKMDKLVIESPMLPVLGTLQDTPVLPHEVQYDVVTDEGTETITVTPTLRFDGEPEFHAMTMREVEIKNLPQITANAFEDCANLEKVDLSGHDSLTRISHHAFNNADKLKTFVFGDGLVGKDVALEEYAFRGTAIETMGDKNTDFALSAANFNAEDAAVFSEMPKLTSVYVPSTFTIQPALADAEKNLNGSTIPAYTFANDPELKEVTLDYQLSKVDESAFLYDNKLEKLFVWGNTNINENDVELTIPEQTTIFAYSNAPAEAYANDESRNNYDGKFYALDEVLYLTSNKSKVLLEQDEDGNNTGFDKTGLKLYGLRRDGVILESDWQDYNTAFLRTNLPDDAKNISFEEGRGALGPDDVAIAATVFDAPKPFNAISLTNENFANVDYEFLTMPSSDNPLIVVHYPDGYTGNIRNTTLVSMLYEPEPEPTPQPTPTPEPQPEDELDVPDTGSYGALIGAATSSVSIATIIVLGGVFIAKRRKN